MLTHSLSPSFGRNLLIVASWCVCLPPDGNIGKIPAKTPFLACCRGVLSFLALSSLSIPYGPRGASRSRAYTAADHRPADPHPTTDGVPAGPRYLTCLLRAALRGARGGSGTWAPRKAPALAVCGETTWTDGCCPSCEPREATKSVSAGPLAPDESFSALLERERSTTGG